MLNTREMLKLNEKAGEDGSWEDLATFDTNFHALQGGQELNVEAFGVKVEAPNFNFDATNNERTQHTLPFMVTDPDFIKINGVPLARPPE